MSSSVDVSGITRTLLTVLPRFSRAEQRLGVALYRQLARGRPVAPAALAPALEYPAARVTDLLRSLDGFVYYDGAERIVGFGGLAVVPMHHRFHVNGRDLFTWCAWDALFVPEMLGAVATVQSACPETEERIRLTVAPDGVKACSHSEVRVSFPVPGRRSFSGDAEQVIATFCHHVFFFANPDAAARWAATRDGYALLTLEEAFDVGKRKNAVQFGDVLPVADGGA